MCRTLVVVGEDDPITPPALAEEIAANIRPDLVRLVHLPEAGHVLALDAPDALGELLRDFVSGVGREASSLPARECPPLGKERDKP